MSVTRRRLALTALALLVALARLHTWSEPIERDLATYAVVGHELLAGRALYSDLWDHKPPAVHASYALGEVLAGYGKPELYLLGVATAVVTLWGVAAAAAALTASPSAGLWAAALFAVTCSDRRLQANQPNVEAFLNPLLVGAFALLLRAGERSAPRRRTVALALFFALASLYKPVAVASAALLLAVHVARPGEAGRRRALLDAAAAAAVGALVWAGALGYFGLTGRSHDFRAAVFTYNAAYGDGLAHGLAKALLPRYLFPTHLLALAPLLAVAALGLAWALVRERGRGPLLLAAYALSTFVAVAWPGRFYPHYYQLWLPVAAIGASWGIHRLAQARGKAPALALGLAVIAALAALQAPDFLRPADEWSRRKYGDTYVEAERLAQEIDRLLAPGETFYDWGALPSLYVATRRSPPTGVVYAMPLLEGPLARELSLRVVRDLARAQPDLVVVELATERPRDHPVVRWFTAGYEPLPAPGAATGPTSAFRFSARANGALASRLRDARAR